MYFETVRKFDFDVDRLYQEWFSLATINNQIPETNDIDTDILTKRYTRININHSDCETGEKYILSPNEISYPLKSYNIKNILPLFQSTYTKEVVEIIEQFFNEQGLRSTRVKYAALKPYGVILTHVDYGLRKRYHFAVKTNDDCSMTVDGETYLTNEANTLYSMYANVPHSVNNNGDNIRLFLSFDVTSIN